MRSRLSRLSRLSRAALLIGALAALTIPGIDAAHVAKACSNAGCSTSGSGSGALDGFVSPITVSSPTSNIERPTSAQVTSPLVLHGNVGFTVTDQRGNNEGFVVQLTTSGYNSSLVSPTVPASDVAVASVPTVDLSCFTNAGEGLPCAPANGNPASVGQTLDTNPIVAVECPAESIGFGAYAVTVPLSVTLTGAAAELFGSLPFSYDATYTATIVEGQPHDYFVAPQNPQFNCPAYGVPAPSPTATSAPTNTPSSTPTNTPSPTATNSPTTTPSPTATDTSQPSAANTATASPTATNSPTTTPTSTPTNTAVTVAVAQVQAQSGAAPSPTATPAASSTAAPSATAKVVVVYKTKTKTKTVTRYKTVPRYKTVKRYKTVPVYHTVVRYKTVRHVVVQYKTKVRQQVKQVVHTVVHHKTVVHTVVHTVYRTVIRHRTITSTVYAVRAVRHPTTGRFALPALPASHEAVSSPDASLSLPRLGIVNAPIWSRGYIDDQHGGFTYDIVPRYGVTRFSYSAPFGAPGLTMAYGHDDIYGSIFRYLGRLQPGDAIVVTNAHHTYRYVVRSVATVNPDDVDMLNATYTHPTLALISCAPFDVDTNRVVVLAQLAP